MTITIRDVERVASLARIELSDTEKEKYAQQLDAILKFVDQLNRLDTNGVDPTTHVIPLANVMREDEVRPSWPLEDVFRNAPDEEDGQFKVPSVLD
ncbi:MAG: asparaginyl/glutamyl-tRNA amidotransferase subunit C [Candidatus Reconcilbacillus cellulovorans]|uniref:Aspartyl/glutamyl-tRNA(Asn/Gln) amidotransferase subunit C n=1 Tax=Candidatus Reconcilbacillus cellulovorans TaxID=1906605 RepID=A0A2A6E3L2_9BACL|nr:MAG: asparaginyl/glutamyl-tRNA amidotransferase subunit C [Candidatus Reconcilbacillus cellulovorans]